MGYNEKILGYWMHSHRLQMFGDMFISLMGAAGMVYFGKKADARARITSGPMSSFLGTTSTVLLACAPFVLYYGCIQRVSQRWGIIRSCASAPAPLEEKTFEALNLIQSSMPVWPPIRTHALNKAFPPVPSSNL